MGNAAPTTFTASTIGKKVTMALSGIALFGFVFVHMLGNLQLFLGRETLNAYSDSLHALGHGAVLWLARAVLLGAVLAHILSAVSLWQRNAAARKTRYKLFAPRASSYASRTMYWSGPILSLFIVFHLLHLTTGTVHPNYVGGDVYHNVVAGLLQPAASAFYIVAMLALGLHLYHGVWSLLHTLGLAHPKYNAARHAAATLFAAVIVVGNISFPVAVLTGLVK